jgi:hypothetical protein
LFDFALIGDCPALFWMLFDFLDLLFMRMNYDTRNSCVLEPPCAGDSGHHFYQTTSSSAAFCTDIMLFQAAEKKDI